jgi:hypothetical protein
MNHSYVVTGGGRGIVRVITDARRDGSNRTTSGFDSPSIPPLHRHALACIGTFEIDYIAVGRAGFFLVLM